jgi:hypothetical protein
MEFCWTTLQKALQVKKKMRKAYKINQVAEALLISSLTTRIEWNDIFLTLLPKIHTKDAEIYKPDKSFFPGDFSLNAAL